MTQFLKTLIEKAPVEVTVYADIIISHILSGIDVDEMRSKRGSDYDSTHFYQIRVKPKDPELLLPAALSRIEKFLLSPKSKKLGIEDVTVNKLSPNSSKYSSVSFILHGTDYDIVVAKGGNEGEKFEKDLLAKMDKLVNSIESSDEAKAAFDALEKVDDDFKMSNIKSVSARTGKTNRSGDLPPNEVGKIIADIIIELNDGSKKYISVKNAAGATVANFGVSKAFSEDLSVVETSTEWQTWLKPFDLDPVKIGAGLRAYRDQVDVVFDNVEKLNKKLDENSDIYKILQKLWGSGYYYLREKGKGFTALNINDDYVKNHLLKNLEITEIKYPYKDRKQISIYLTSASKRYKVEIRNSKGKIRPSEIKFGVMGDTK